jgi:3-oxoacyl-[acyl-carrier protein] reductase
MKLAGKVALVTGSSRGIGARIAIRLAAEGASVALQGRDVAALTAVGKAVESAGGRGIQVVGDVRKFDEIEAMRQQIERELGPIDILVTNAGGSPTPPAPLEELTEAGWHNAIDANLTATFLTLKSILPRMKERRAGCIVTMASSAARRPQPRAPLPYAVAKAGIVTLTQQLAAQVGPLGIRVNCIAPDTILTENNQQRIPTSQLPGLVEQHPLRRLGTPDDVAAAALYLASDDASWVTGVVLDVTGGAVMV